MYFMRLHSLQQEKRKKIVSNSKWRQNPKWMLKFVLYISSTEFCLFQNAFFLVFSTSKSTRSMPNVYKKSSGLRDDTWSRKICINFQDK
jgi:hypothetical protein